MTDEKTPKLTAVEGGIPLAKTVAYPKLLHLKHEEQRASWMSQLKSAEQQVQGFYMMARAYPANETHQEQYQESLEALENLRAAYEEWKKDAQPSARR